MTEHHPAPKRRPWPNSTGGRASRGLIMVPAWRGQPTVDELARQARAGERPRSDYVELARELEADVLDMHYLQHRATPMARALARRAVVPAQVLEAFLAGRQYGHVVARADRMGLPLALLNKLTRGRRDVVLVSVWLSVPKKAVFLSRLRVHSHLGAIINYGSVQMAYAHDRLGVPLPLLHHALQPVDERFFVPLRVPLEDYVCAVGSEARDYPTFVQATAGLEVRAEIAVGSTLFNASGDVHETFRDVVDSATGGGLPSHVRVRTQLDHRALRDLYAKARLVVVPLQDVDADCGVTVIAEAMAMGKAVVVSGTRGQVDLVRHGENGLYVPPGDPSALRAAVRRLLDDPEEGRRMGQAGRALVEERLTLDRWVRTVATVTRASVAA